MEALDSARMYARFAWRLIHYLRTPWTVGEAEAAIRTRLREREDRFLRILQEQIYGNPRSPYARLLKWAGCELGDVAARLRADGLKETLNALYRAGVYVKFEEFKGHAPIYRGSQQLAVKNTDFDNHRGRPDFFGQTSGSTGAPVRVPLYLNEIANAASANTLIRRGMNLEKHRTGLLLPIGGTAIYALLTYAKAGLKPERWFSVTDPALPGLDFRYRWSGQILSAWSTLFGVGLPKPELVDSQKLDPVVLWCRDAAPVFLIAFSSSAVRVCNRAMELGISLDGSCFLVGGEPLTAERRASIARTGAGMTGLYVSMEGGVMGLGCLREGTHEEEDYHLRTEDLHVMMAPRAVQAGAPLLFTSLTLAGGKILLNVELGDTGELHEEPCGCYLDSLGLRQHLSRVRSVGKLKAEGMTVLKSDVTHLIEAVLPRRLGGRPGDFQLVQRAAPDGIETLDLWISPDLHLENGAGAVSAFLEELARLDTSYRVVADVWGKAGTVREVQSRPVFAGGKSPAVRIETE